MSLRSIRPIIRLPRTAQSVAIGERLANVPGGGETLPPVTPDVVFSLTPATEHQRWRGIIGEVQFDSIDGDGAGIQEANTRSFPHGLSDAERTRAADTAMAYDGNPYVYHRMALGLYLRAFDPTGRFVNRERAPGANAAMKAMLDRAGGALACGYWSPPPFYKRNTPVQGGPTYDGALITPPDRLTDPAGWNTYLRNLLQGGVPNHPDKATNPSGYAAWMSSFAADTLKTLEYVHQNIGRVGLFFVQNEPTHTARYPSCEWASGEALYDALKAVDSAIAGSSVLATYNGQPNTILYWHDEMQGQQGRGTGFIKADAALLNKIVGWAAHDIEPIATDANVIYASQGSFNNFLAGTGAAAGITRRRMWTENEQFDPYVTPGSAKYNTNEYYFANIILATFNAMVYTNSPAHSAIIHVAKDTDTAFYEQLGRATIRWRPTGSPAPSDLPGLAQGAWAPNPYAYNSTMALIRHLKNDSRRIDMAPVTRDAAVGHVAIKRPDGRIVVGLVNRGPTAKVVQVPLGDDTFDGFGYDIATFGASLGARTGTVNLTLQPYQAQFWVGRSGTPIDITAPSIITSSQQSVAENSVFSIILTANEAVTWTLAGGPDAARFTLTGSTLSMSAKDFESPIDANTDNAYVVTVQATDAAGNSSTKTITVAVTNVDETAPPSGYTINLASYAGGTDLGAIPNVTRVNGTAGSMSVASDASHNLNSTDTSVTGTGYRFASAGAIAKRMRVTNALATNGTGGPVFCVGFVDENNWIGWRPKANAHELVQKLNGTASVVGTVNRTTVAGETVDITMAANGAVSVAVNGSAIGLSANAPAALQVVTPGAISRSASRTPAIGPVIEITPLA